MPPSPSRLIPLIVVLVSASILGLAPILVRLTETGPAAAGFWRLLFALPLLLILVGRPGGEGFGRPSKWMLLAGLFFSMDLSFWHYGIVMTSVANATVLCNLTPVVVTLFGWFVLKERPHRLFLVALALGEVVIPAGPAGWAACIAMGVMHVFGQGGVAWALGKLPASVTAVTILVQPVVAGLLGWWIFGETLTPVQALGGVLVLGAIVLAQRSQKAKPVLATDAPNGLK